MNVKKIINVCYNKCIITGEDKMMTKFKIKNIDFFKLIDTRIIKYPKDLTTLLNYENQFGQGCRPRNVGEMSSLIVEYEKSCKVNRIESSVDGWKIFYMDRHPHALRKATDCLYNRVTNTLLINTFSRMRGVSVYIEEDNQILDYCEQWIEDLLINKTYAGMNFQKAILNDISNNLQLSVRTSTAEEESRGIDGIFKEQVNVSIKPITYSVKKPLRKNEEIRTSIIYYEKGRKSINYSINKELMNELCMIRA